MSEIPRVFWFTLMVAPLTMTAAVLLGRRLVGGLPYRLRSPARFYLAPALGLASLTILASWVGKWIPLADIRARCLFGIAITFALAAESRRREALAHALVVSASAIACGTGLLSALFVFGNPGRIFNDAYTYLCHAQWLQHHAFSETIPAAAISQANSAIAQYQQHQYRMGASYLLGLVQSLLMWPWPVEVCGAVLICSMGSCCWAMGFPLARQLRSWPRYQRFLLLTLPALSQGGLFFATFYGFWPESIGMTLAAAFVFLLGPLLAERTTPGSSVSAAILLAAATCAYSEVSPFLLAGFLASGGYIWLGSRQRQTVGFCFAVLILTMVFLNVELVRTINAVRTQAGVVVGNGVPWGILGYLAHMLGIHGGTWSTFQWDDPPNSTLKQMYLGWFLLGCWVLLLARARRVIWRGVTGGALAPAAAVMGLFTLAFLHFRYRVPAPFPVGKGQSWSQFKLSDWAHPIVAVFLTLAFSYQLRKMGRRGPVVLVSVWVICVMLTAKRGGEMALNERHIFDNVRDFCQLHREFRSTALATCPPGSPLYLNLHGWLGNYRRIAVLYLSERELRADWKSDSYLSIFPAAMQQTALDASCWVLEAKSSPEFVSHGKTIGPFILGKASHLRDGIRPATKPQSR